MVRFNVPISDILGLSYYRYALSSDAVNVSLGSSVTVTCTVTNVFGSVVSGKELTLYFRGNSEGTATTNNNGVATWTITPTATGLSKLVCGNATNYITVGGWQTKTVNTYTTFYVNERERLASFKYYRTNYSFSNTNEVTLHTGAIPSDYRPLTAIICASYRADIVGAVSTNGNITCSTTASGTKNINIYAFWRY